MKMKKLLTKALLVTAGLCAGVNGAWADVTTLYERGTSNAAWADADLNDWTNTNCTPSISGGLYVALYNTEWSTKTTISPTENAIITINATINGAKATGRNGSYDFVKVGGLSFRIYGQDQKATIDIDGTETTLATGITRGADYSIKFVIDTSNGAVTYAYNGATDTDGGISTTAITEIVYGHHKGGGEATVWGNFDTTLKMISVSEEEQTVTTANYTLNYVVGGTTVKSETLSGVVDNPVTLTTAQKANFTQDEVTYIYESDDAEGKTISSDGTTVVTLTYHVAATWNYSVVSSLGTALASGSILEGNSVTVTYPRWELSETTLYSCGSGAISYSTTFTPDEDNYVKTITYNSGTVSDVVFYTEGEDVAEVTVGANAARASMGKMGYTGGSDTYKDATTLSPGKYKIYMRGQNGNSAARAFNFKVGESVVFTGSFANGTNTDLNSDEFTIYENSTLSFASEGSSQSGIDYFYVVKTGDAAVSGTIAASGYSSLASAYGLDFSAATGLTAAYVVTKITNDAVTLTSVNEVPASTGVILKGTGGEAYSIPVKTDAAYTGANYLQAAVEATAIEANAALILKDGKFQKVTEASTVPAGKAYLLATDVPNEARSLVFTFDDESTGIQAVSAELQNSDFYNLQGQRVDSPKKGLYIVKGKKVIIK